MSARGRWQGVFLDFYGTLASGDVQAVEAVCQSVINDHHLPLAASQMAAAWGQRFFAAIENCNGHAFKMLRRIEEDTLIETVFPHVGRIPVARYIEEFNAYLARPTLYDEVPAVLASLSVPVCIVSNADERELRSALAYHGIGPAHIVSSESACSYKPESGIFDYALRLTDWSPDRIIHVGDSLHSDVWGAHRVGIKAAWVNRTTRISDIGSEEPDYAWTDLRPLADLMRG